MFNVHGGFCPGFQYGSKKAGFGIQKLGEVKMFAYHDPAIPSLFFCKIMIMSYWINKALYKL